MQILSAFGGGLWIIPLATLIGAIWSAYRGYRSMKSGSRQQHGISGTTESDINVPFFKTGGGIYFLILMIATIAIVWLMINDR